MQRPHAPHIRRLASPFHVRSNRRRIIPMGEVNRPGFPGAVQSAGLWPVACGTLLVHDAHETAVDRRKPDDADHRADGNSRHASPAFGTRAPRRRACAPPWAPSAMPTTARRARPSQAWRASVQTAAASAPGLRPAWPARAAGKWFPPPPPRPRSGPAGRSPIASEEDGTRTAGARLDPQDPTPPTRSARIHLVHHALPGDVTATGSRLRPGPRVRRRLPS